MNKLMGRASVFKVMPGNVRCTTGVDIAPRFLPLNMFASSSEHAFDAVGFCDAEGTGDRDAAYDLHLLAPLLVVSKVIIFNWKVSARGCSSFLSSLTRACMYLTHVFFDSLCRAG